MMTVVIEWRPNMFDDRAGRHGRVSDEEGELSEGSAQVVSVLTEGTKLTLLIK